MDVLTREMKSAYKVPPFACADRRELGLTCSCLRSPASPYHLRKPALTSHLSHPTSLTARSMGGQVDELYMVYVVVLVVIIEILRYVFIAARMGDFSAASQVCVCVSAWRSHCEPLLTVLPLHPSSPYPSSWVASPFYGLILLSASSLSLSPSQIDYTPGASLMARAKATAAKVAPKGSPAAKGSPAKGKMAANSKKTPSMH